LLVIRGERGSGVVIAGTQWVRSRSDRRIQVIRHVVQVGVEEVGVHIERHRRLGVAKHPLHRFDIRPGADGETGGGVA
jgi:hypothetical protein